jgi:predicted small secreted protein
MSRCTKGMLGLVLMPALFGFALLTSGCNTMKGAGEDVSAAGGAMSSGAQKTEDKIKEETTPTQPTQPTQPMQ